MEIKTMTDFNAIKTDAAFSPVVLGRTFFKITDGARKGLWAAPEMVETACKATARHALLNGHKVQSFAGRQGRRITNTKAGIA